jgi:hypothetical protein
MYYSSCILQIDLCSRCEHYSIQLGGTRDHLFSYEAGTGLYDEEYLEALFDGNTEEITQIEGAAYKDGFGPLASCSMMSNHNSIKVHCRESIFTQCLIVDSLQYSQHANIEILRASLSLLK